jgi:hypothetical protein
MAWFSSATVDQINRGVAIAFEPTVAECALGVEP